MLSEYSLPLKVRNCVVVQFLVLLFLLSENMNATSLYSSDNPENINLYGEKKLDRESDIQRLVEALTLWEKSHLLAGKNAWQTYEVARLEIPSITLTDGPHGVRSFVSDSFNFR